MNKSIAKRAPQHFTLGQWMASEEKQVLMSMELGQRYTRRQLHQLAGLGLCAVDRTVSRLVRLGDVRMAGSMVCPVTQEQAAAVALSLADGA